MKILITGSAGFIGAHCAAVLAKNNNYTIVGVDNFNAYYDPNLKHSRVEHLVGPIRQLTLDIADAEALKACFEREQPDLVVHLAAQAGVRHSFKAPMAYARSNLFGQVSVLEAARNTPSVKRLIYASSSSVYSGVPTLPFKEDTALGTPKSLYAATKIADEVLCDTYSALHGIDMIGLRFFTVYGPWGRPDMAYWTFAESILEGRQIKLFNFGDVRRDFTYIDDVTAVIQRMADETHVAPNAEPQHRRYNIGNHSPIAVGDMIGMLEEQLGVKANIALEPLPPGDMVETFANVDRLQIDYDYSPSTPLETGLRAFTDWFVPWRAGAKKQTVS